eukprot:3204221-Alexandrium_andersonii.AAC.1
MLAFLTAGTGSVWRAPAVPKVGAGKKPPIRGLLTCSLKHLKLRSSCFRHSELGPHVCGRGGPQTVRNSRPEAPESA